MGEVASEYLTHDVWEYSSEAGMKKHLNDLKTNKIQPWKGKIELFCERRQALNAKKGFANARHVLRKRFEITSPGIPE